MAEKLLVVEEAFVVRGPGVLVLPRFTVTDPPKGAFPVRLVLPGGGERPASATVEVAHMRNQGVYAMYRLVDMTVDDVPAGTEIWRD